MKLKGSDSAERNPGKRDGAARIVSAIKRLNACIERTSERALATYNLHPSGLEVLDLLSSGPAHGMQLAEIAKQLGVTPASITNRIDHLISKGWVERRVNEKDRRYASAVLTKAGQKVLAVAGPILAQAQKELFSSLKKGDRKELLRMLEKISDQPTEAAE